MVPKITKGKGVSGAVRYVLGEGRDSDGSLKTIGETGSPRAIWFGGQNFGFTIHARQDVELARRFMEFVAMNQTSPTRKVEQDCVHLTLNWRTGETPELGTMEEAARGALKALGMENALAIWAAHDDTDHPHLHIVASKINPDTGRAFDLYKDQFKLSKWAHAWELAHGNVQCPGRESSQALFAAAQSHDPEQVVAALTRHRATFTAQDVDQLLGRSGLKVLQRAQLVERVIAHQDVIPVYASPDSPTPSRYSTRATLRSEAYVLHATDDLAQRGGYGLEESTLNDVVAARTAAGKAPRADQLAALRHATLGGSALALVDGHAGAGKSYAIELIREAHEKSGYRVVGLAPTNEVANDLADSGFKHAGTIARELTRLLNDRTQWDRQTCVIIDEAGMVNTTDLAELATAARDAGAKLILVGDPNQLASIERGGMFDPLAQRYGAAHLTEIVRQADATQREASLMLAQGWNVRGALQIYDQLGAIHWNNHQSEARAALVQRYLADTAQRPEKSRFVFAYTNADVGDLNAAIRAGLLQRGDLGRDEHILNTAYGELAFSANDRLQFTKTLRKQGIFSGATGTIIGIEGSKVSVRLDRKGNPTVTFDSEEFQHFRHGYAGTIYKGQGKTLSETYLYHTRHWRQATGYVALTRHRDSTAVFAARETARDLEQLARQLSRLDNTRAASWYHLKPEHMEPVRRLDLHALNAELGGRYQVNDEGRARTATAKPSRAPHPFPRPSWQTQPQPRRAVQIAGYKKASQAEEAQRAKAGARAASTAQETSRLSLRQAPAPKGELKDAAQRKLSKDEAFLADLQRGLEITPEQNQSRGRGRSRSRGSH